MGYSVSRDVVDAFYKAYAAHDTGGLAPLLHDDIEWVISGPVEVMNWCGTWRTKADVLDLVDRVIPSHFRVVTFARSSLLLDGDQVATLNRLTATRNVDGRVISFRLAHFMRFKDDKVIRNLSLIDTFDAVEQMLGHPLAVGEPHNAQIGDLVAV